MDNFCGNSKWSVKSGSLINNVEDASTNINIDIDTTSTPYTLTTTSSDTISMSWKDIDMTPEGVFLRKIKTKYKLKTDWDAYDWILKKLELIDHMENNAIEEFDKLTNE